MTSVAEPVAVNVMEHAAREDVAVSTPTDVAMTAVAETSEEALATPPADLAPIPATTATAEVQIHVPYQVDLTTPRLALHSGGGGDSTPATTKESKAAGTHGASSTPPPPVAKTKGRPSQAPLHAARMAPRTREGITRSASQGPLQRSQRRQPSAASTTPSDGAVLSAATRRVPAPTGDTSKTTTTTTITSTRAGNSVNVLLRRPRFVDPMPTTPTAAAEAVQRSRPVRPIGSNTHLASTMPPTTSPTSTSDMAATGHAALYIHPIPHHNPTRTPPRAPASPQPASADGAAAADAPHRRRSRNSGHATTSAHRGAASLESTTMNTTTTTTAAINNNKKDSSSNAVEGAAATQEDGTRPLSPPSPSVEVAMAKTESERTESEAAVDVHEKSTAEEYGAASTDEAAAAVAAKPAPRYTHPTRESQVKVLPATVAPHPDKRVILSRPTSRQYSLRMSELTRPSEAYKVSLSPSLHSSALARRSRQPHKVLNVFLTKYPVIRKLADELGWVMETTEDELNEYKFNLCWSDTVLSLMRLVRLSNWQRTNHFPSMYLLCRKGHLGTTLGKLRHKLPSHFAFYPRTWSMRSERLQFTQYLTAVRQRRILKYFIMKPNSGCQGRGIVVARDPLTALDEHTLDNYIVQEYIHRPLLLEGKKFDLRVYVLLTSIRHPSIFLFNDGLVRICTEQYEAPTEENVKNACKHLTNYAVNKKSSEYVFNTDVEHMDVGNKRNFAFLNRWLEDSGHSSAELWKQVGIIIVKTILSAQPSIARVYDSCFPTGFNDGYCCFEVLGFDILIDHKMKPWLMEVNHTPSFATETPLDLDIKSKLLTEVWSIIDCKATDYEKDRQRERDEFTKRNMPPWTSNHPLYGSHLGQSSARHGALHDDDASAAQTNGSNSAAAGTRADSAEIPAYVHTRRAHEDSKLRNFKRIYPSQDEDVQLMYDTVQNLALAESANSRLYYNSTVAAPVMPPSTSPSSTTAPAPFGVRSSNPLPLRARPPSLGPALTASRVYSSNSSPNAAAAQRSLASPMIPPTSTTPMAPPNGAPSTIPVSSVPSLTVVRESHQSTPASSPAANGSASATSPHGTSSAVSRGESSSGRARVQATTNRDPNVSATRNGVMSSENSNSGAAAASAAAPAPPLSTFLAAAEVDAGKQDGNRTSVGTIPKTTDKSPSAAAQSQQQLLRVFTPRVSSPTVNSRNTTAASTPPAAAVAAKQQNRTGTSAAAVKATDGTAPAAAVKPRVAEVHRRASSKPSTASQTTPTLHDREIEEQLSQLSNVAAAAAGNAAEVQASPNSLSLPQHKSGTPSKADKVAETSPATNSLSHTYHQNGSVVKPPAGVERQNGHTTSPAIRITRTSVGRQKSPSLDVTPNASSNGDAPQQQQLSTSITKRHSLSMSGSGRGFPDAAPVTAHPRQKSSDREGHSMSTHPEPTEEELARLVALQAQLDYEAAADPQPDDEDEDYNLTE
jgi:tubulin polyglutamylase TTLL6/13